ncbi:sensor histidine kinase [Actinoallomurus iriomotensis]|uniref:Oxygen sensor histidine kinase NreB n=1 Tax=Actinoallomurus iriomotensis TaxID=478107 RepID=A0A9W6RRQ6_9ACTN|nr:sensor histidine kinase [Actinoallomurus iriomotensis]GLY81326.1 histidine kinase [Actinoallomurus iriomotensis]
MSGPAPRARLNAREQWPVAVAVLPYLLLVLLAAVTVAEKHASGGLTFDLVLCAFAALWTLGMVTLRPAWRDNPAAMAVFFAVLMAIVAVLVVRDPWWGFFAPAGYVFAFRLFLWPWRLLAVAAMAVVAGTAQASTIAKTTLFGLIIYLAVVVANILPMWGLAWVIWRNGEQNDQREQALREAREANRRLEASLAENAGLHERLVAQAREAGIMDERQRMAREIHDTLAQGLTGIITQLQAADQAGEDAGEDAAEWRRHVTAATRLARESLTEARRSVHALRPEPLETARLSEALTGVAGRWSSLHGLAVEVTTTGTARPMDREVEVALLRTAQEALANVARHARATRVGVTLSYMENEVALDVRDDGCGFDPAKMTGERTETGGGFGLVAMRQRIEGLSGTLQVESEPGGGTGISACVPAAEASA